jgi:hypothetical protein
MIALRRVIQGRGLASEWFPFWRLKSEVYLSWQGWIGLVKNMPESKLINASVIPRGLLRDRLDATRSSKTSLSSSKAVSISHRSW